MIRFKRALFIFVIFILINLLGACSSVSITETSAPDIVSTVPEDEVGTENAENAYPYPQPTKDQSELYPTASYPIETQETVDEELVVPTPSDDTAVIYGVVISLTTEDKILYSKVYLASKIPVEPGDEYLISIQENSSPHSTTNAQGEFVISEITPGDYILLLVTPASTFPILTESGEQIELLIEGGELIDLGDIFTNWPNF